MCVYVYHSFFCDGTATTEIYTNLHTRSRHEALPISLFGIRKSRSSMPTKRRTGGRLPTAPLMLGGTKANMRASKRIVISGAWPARQNVLSRSEEHTSELQSLMRISYAVFCLYKKLLTLSNIYITKRHTHMLLS